MKRISTILSGLLIAGAASAQTLNVVVGEVTYQVPAAQAGDMVYADGTTLTILNKSFALSEVSSMYISDDAVTDNTVSVAYDGTSAAVKIAGNCMQYLNVTAKGAAISIVQSDDLAEEITYNLSGTSTNGSFYMDGSYKATVALNGLDLISEDSAAVKIENGKRIDLVIEGTNTLRDRSTSNGKGALMVNGHSEISGSGTLNLYGYAKNAYWADEYVQMKKSMTGTINILYASKDGLNVNQYFEQNGGTLNISGVYDDGIQVSADDDETGYVNLQGGTLNIKTTAAAAKGIKADGSITINEAKNTTSITITNSGTGKWDSDDAEVKGSACISSDANITIDAGTIKLTATGNGGKGMKCDSVLTVNDGSLTVNTSGKQYVNIGGTQEYDGNYSGKFESLNDAYSTSPKGIKVGIKSSATGNIIINGGTVNVTASGQQDGSEGIESKNTLYTYGGTINVTAYDDAVNASKDIHIKGGTITTLSKNNDGIDSNNNLYIEGGVVAAFGASSPECSFDAAEGYNLYFNGGIILGVGGTSISPSKGSTQCYVASSSTVTAGSTIKLSNGSTTLATFTVPSDYSSSSSNTGQFFAPGNMGGNMGGGSQIIMSTPELKSNSSYTLTNGSTTSSVTAAEATSSSSGMWGR